MDNKDYVNRAVEVSTHIGLIFLLAAACFLMLRPFLPTESCSSHCAGAECCPQSLLLLSF